MIITGLFARQILDSRGMPTLECDVYTNAGVMTRASVPAGLSRSKYECYEWRDNDAAYYHGNSVLRAVASINDYIGPKLVGLPPDSLFIDKLLCELDATKKKSVLGANTLLAVSSAVVKAEALAHGKRLYQWFGHLLETTPCIPRLLFSLINGGLHGDSTLAFQEFLLTPSLGSLDKDLACVFNVSYALKERIREERLCTSVGDGGGFTPHFKKSIDRVPEHDALDFLTTAILQAGYSRDDVDLGLDVAASTFYDVASETYQGGGICYTSSQSGRFYEELIEKYRLTYIEDPCAQDDWLGWERVYDCIKNRCVVAGDDLFATHVERIEQAQHKKSASAVVIKPNQIGTISETLDAIRLCRRYGYDIVISHRSGETLDTLIVDLAVGAQAEWLKAGACMRGERVAKYNRLLEIEEEVIKKRGKSKNIENVT